MSDSQRTARPRSMPTRRRVTGRRRFTDGTVIRLALPLLALSGFLFVAPAMAKAAEPGGGSAAASTSTSALFWGLDLITVFWLSAGLLAVAAGLFAGSGSRLGTQVASANAVAAQPSVVIHSTADQPSAIEQMRTVTSPSDE